MTSREAEIQARLDAATPGPWEYNVCGDWDYGVGLYPGVISLSHGDTIVEFNLGSRSANEASSSWGADAFLIANAPDDLEYLLSRVATLEAQVEAVRGLIPYDLDDDWEDDWTRGNNSAWRLLLKYLDSAGELDND